MIQVSDFSSRPQLEQHVISLYGQNTEKVDDVISGTVQELKKLNLKDGQMVYGVKCEATDKEPPKKFEKPNRGKKHAYGINVE